MAGALFLRDAKKQGFEEGFAQGALFVRDAKKQGFDEGEAFGLAQGIAKQKAEDEKLLQQTVAQVTAQKDAEIAALKAQLESMKK